MTYLKQAPVEQCDREAAANLEAWERDDSKRTRFLSGEFDSTCAVQLFATHRLAERERCQQTIEALEQRVREADAHRFKGWEKPLHAMSDNVLLWRLGEAASKAGKHSAGDYIDVGLALLAELEAAGFQVRTALSKGASSDDR